MVVLLVLLVLLLTGKSRIDGNNLEPVHLSVSHFSNLSAKK
jgi:hypothetical protein